MRVARKGAGTGANEWRWVAGSLLFLWFATRHNPAGFVFDAGAPAYYQARVAVERGDVRAEERVARAFRGGWISQNGYSDDVFPVYRQGIHPPEDPFPPSERAKPVEQLRAELARALARGGRQALDSAGR